MLADIMPYFQLISNKSCGFNCRLPTRYNASGSTKYEKYKINYLYEK